MKIAIRLVLIEFIVRIVFVVDGHAVRVQFQRVTYSDMAGSTITEGIFSGDSCLSASVYDQF